MAANPIAVSIYDGREAFYQWDLNQRIVLAGVEAGQEVHYENSSVAECPVVETYELDGRIVADVPNEMLQYPEHMRAHIYIEDDAGISITQFSALLRVLNRKKPSDYVYTPTEVKRWDTLERRIEEVNARIVQPSMAQNDETAMDYVRDRTHWTETTVTEILPPTTVETVDHVFITNMTLGVEAGKRYSAYFDGVQYDSECTCVVDDDEEIYFIGNTALADMDADTGEPFVFVKLLYANMVGVITTRDDGEHTVALSYTDVSVHQLDPKYYERLGWVEDGIVPEEVFGATDEFNGNPPIHIFGIDSLTILQPGETYRVIIDGSSLGDYVAQAAEGGGASLGSLNGRVFCLAGNDGASDCLVVNLLDGTFAAGEHTVSICRFIAGEVVHKIDPKFLPDMGSGLPEVTASDDGKFLRVSGGAWTAVELPDAEGVAF